MAVLSGLLKRALLFFFDFR